MNVRELTERSIYIITEYYKDNLQPYFESIDDDILWIGPAKGQWLRGKTSILDAWAQEEHDLTFSMNNITSRYITSDSQYCEIILNYGVFTHYPNGHLLHHDQVLHYTWCNRIVKTEDGSTHKEPKILMIHISNFFPYDSRDSIYSVHLAELAVSDIQHSLNGSRLLVRGINRSTYYLLTDSITWMESRDNGTHTIIHTASEDYNVINSVTEIQRTYPDLFIRIHSSYLINPMYAHNIQRFQVELADGTTLPIPQKKYTKIKEQFAQWIEAWNKKVE